MKDIDKIKELIERVKSAEHKTDFVISWFAKKYNKTIFRAGHLNKVGCRTWERNGDKYICFFDGWINSIITIQTYILRFSI